MKRTVCTLLCVLFLITLLPKYSPALAAFRPSETTFSESYKAGKYYKQLQDVKLTGNGAKDIVSVAMSQKGYMEGNTKSQLSGEKSGSSNYTEYGRWVTEKSGSKWKSCTHGAWCARFVSWCAAMAGISQDVFPIFISATANTLKKAGAEVYSWKDYIDDKVTPQPGDIIIYRRASRGGSYKYSASSKNFVVDTGSHVEILYDYSETYGKKESCCSISTVGGNTGDENVKAHCNMSVKKSTGMCDKMGMYVYAIVRPRYCDHKWDASGTCTNTGCDQRYDWAKTRETNGAGVYKVVGTAAQPWSEPYKAVPSQPVSGKLPKNTRQIVTATVSNAAGQVWYELGGEDCKGHYVEENQLALLWREAKTDNTWYCADRSVAVFSAPQIGGISSKIELRGTAPAGTMLLTSHRATTVSGEQWLKIAQGDYANCYVAATDMTLDRVESGLKYEGNGLPTEQLLPGEPYALTGTVSSNYKLKSIRVEILRAADSKVVAKAACTADGTTESLDERLDQTLNIAALEVGAYRLHLYGTDEKVTDLKIAESSFVIDYSYGVIYFHSDVDVEIPETLAFDDGAAVLLPNETPTSPYHTFKGWSLTDPATGSVEADYQPGDVYTGNTCHLYAVWSPRLWFIFFATPDLSDLSAYGACYVGMDYVLPDTRPADKDGMTFVGWATSDNTNVPEYRPGDTIPSQPEGSVVNLHKVWKPLTEMEYVVESGGDDVWERDLYGNYTLTDGTVAGDAVLCEYTGLDSIFTVPDELDGHPVTSLRFFETVTIEGWGNFQYATFLNDAVETMWIPAGIRFVRTVGSFQSDRGYYGAGGMKNLREFVVDGENAFYQSVNGMLLTKDGKTIVSCPAALSSEAVFVPAGVTTLGRASFSAVKAQQVFLPDSVTTICENAFAYAKITSLTVPAGVLTVENGSFDSCGDLTYVRFLGTPPENAGADVFWNFEENPVIYYPAEFTEHWDDDGDGKWKGLTAMPWPDLEMPGVLFYQSDFKTKMPDAQVIAGAAAVTVSTQIPAAAGVTFLGWRSGDGSRYNPGDTISLVDGTSVTLTAIWTTDNGLRYRYDREQNGLVVTAYVGDANSLGIPSFVDLCSPSGITGRMFVRGIADGAFAGNQTLESVSVGGFVTAVGNYAFFGCESLNKVEITRLSSSTPALGAYAFGGCSEGFELVFQDMFPSFGGNTGVKICTLKITSQDTVTGGEKLVLTAACDCADTADQVVWALEDDCTYAQLSDGVLMTTAPDVPVAVSLTASVPGHSDAVARQILRILPPVEEIVIYEESEVVSGTLEVQELPFSNGMSSYLYEVAVLPEGASYAVAVQVENDDVATATYDMDTGVLTITPIALGRTTLTVSCNGVQTKMKLWVNYFTKYDKGFVSVDSVNVADGKLMLQGTHLDSNIESVQLYVASYTEQGKLLAVCGTKVSDSTWNLSLPSHQEAAFVQVYVVQQKSLIPLAEMITIQLSDFVAAET